MRRLIFAVIMALLVFALLNFVRCNLNDDAFTYPVVFKFWIPLILPNGFKTVPMPLGFILLVTFCVGMVFVALFEAIPSIYKSMELRAKNKKIRELERELTVARQLAGVDKDKSAG